MVGRSSATGVPVYGYQRLPGVPPVRVLRRHEAADHVPGHAHAHEFIILIHVVGGGGFVHVDERDWRLEPGDLFVVAPGEVVTPMASEGLDDLDLWMVLFPPDVVEAAAPGAFQSWRSHPLLLPYVRGIAGGVQRLRIPPGERQGVAAHVTAMDRELRERRDGYDEAVLAHLTLLLVAVSRLAAGAAGDVVRPEEPLLAAVFDVIESRYREPISLKDVAAAVRLTPGHLTTAVGRRTGRTVQEWITERRMAEARRLLATTDLTVDALAGRVGYRDAGYFIKRFRRAHGASPQQWRRAGRR